MNIILTVLHVIAAITLILTVLLQAGKGAGIGAAFGGSSETVFGARGPTTFLSKLTAGVAITFMLTSFLLTYVSGSTRPAPLSPQPRFNNNIKAPPPRLRLPQKRNKSAFGNVCRHRGGQKVLIKRLLLLVPLSVSLVIFQSYFWVPTFSDQTIGSKQRLTQYIAGSIGDAQILNPILHSDASSGNIVDLVFEGLIDRDKDLSFRGRLATSWRVYEEAYFVPRPGGPGAEEIRSQLERARDGSVRNGQSSFEKVEVVPPAEEEETIRTPPRKTKEAGFGLLHHLLSLRA